MLNNFLQLSMILAQVLKTSISSSLILIFNFLVRNSFSTEINAGVIATMKKEFKELQHQLLSNLSTEMNANLLRFKTNH